MAMTNAEMAEALINTKTLPPGLLRVRELTAQARAYYKMKPYPFHFFRDWDQSKRGPLPRCLPLAQRIVKRGALWLFGKPITIQVAANESLQTYLRAGWERNRMPSRLRAVGEKAALEGGIVLKWSVDEANKGTFDIQTLSVVDQVRLYFHPHDRDMLLMARVQYPFWDAVQQKRLWYREEWTDAREVHYHPVEDDALNQAKGNPDTYAGWIIDETASKPNPFKIIPLHLCKNLETDDVWGAGDLWSLDAEDGLFRVIDRINLTYHLMDNSNQYDSQMRMIGIDVEGDAEADERPLEPGQPLFLDSTNAGEGSGKGSVLFGPTSNDLRPHMMDYAEDLQKQVLDAANSVIVDQAEITNKGNLTTAVLEVIYAPQIDITTEKQKSMGADGIAAFLSRTAQGLQNAGIALNVSGPASCAVTLLYSPFFEPSGDEKTGEVTRTQDEEAAGYLSHDRAIERVAKLNKIEDVAKLKTEIAAQPPLPNDANADSAAV